MDLARPKTFCWDKFLLLLKNLMLSGKIDIDTNCICKYNKNDTK